MNLLTWLIGLLEYFSLGKYLVSSKWNLKLCSGYFVTGNVSRHSYIQAVAPFKEVCTKIQFEKFDLSPTPTLISC